MIKTQIMLHAVVGPLEARGDKIIEIIKANRSIKKVDLQQKVAEEIVEVHPRTLNRYPKGKGYRKWIAKRRPKLTAAHAASCSAYMGYLKRLLHQKSPNIASLPGGPVAVKKRIAESLAEAWKEIPTSLLDSLSKSMPRRVAAVTKAGMVH